MGAEKGVRHLPAVGPARALLVFVRFRDDQREGDRCARGSFAWPPSDSIPSYGHHVLSPTPTTSLADSSLTRFFQTYSNGAFSLYGDAVGYTTAQDEDAYFPTGPSADLNGLTREILDTLQGRGIDFSVYDGNRDGVLDHLFIVVRSFRYGHGLYDCVRRADGGVRECASGVASLGLSASISDPSIYGIVVDKAVSGSYAVSQAVDPLWETVLLLAHEYGHGIWGQRGLTQVHLTPPWATGVPANDDRAVGYALMVGGRGWRPVASPTPFVSAAERDILTRSLESDEPAWIQCTDVGEGRNTYVLEDIETSGDCLRLPFGGEGGLYLSNVQPTSYFTRPRTPKTTVSDECPGCVRVEYGLQASGLLMEAVWKAPGSTPAYRGVVPADNDLSGFVGCDLLEGVGETGAAVFGGDFWTDRGTLHRTPWTRPNIFGASTLTEVPVEARTGAYPALEEAFVGGDGRGYVTAYSDYTRQDTAFVREDWWIGRDAGPLTFRHLRVMAGTSLHLTKGADLRILKGLTVEVGARLLMEYPGTGGAQTLRFGPDAQLVVEGDFEVDYRYGQGWTMSFSAIDPLAGWRGLHIRPGPAAIELGPLQIYNVNNAAGALTVRGREVTVERLQIAGTGGGAALAVSEGASVLAIRAEILDNDGAVVQATSGATVRFEQDLLAEGNGGVFDVDGATVWAGGCTDGPCAHVPYRLAGNLVAGGFHVRAVNGGSVVAQGNDWGVGPDSLVVVGEVGRVFVAPVFVRSPPQPPPPESPLPPGSAVVAVSEVQPNPTAGEASVVVDLPSESSVAGDLSDTRGRTQPLRRQTLPMGQHRLMLPTNGLPSGLYVVRLYVGLTSEAFVRTFVIVR